MFISASNRPKVRLCALAFLTLFLELAIIRFSSAEVLYLGYFSNYILIAVFLGIGLGFLAGNRQVQLFHYIPQVILFLIAFILLTKTDIFSLTRKTGQLYFSTTQSLAPLPLWLTLPLLFGSTVFIFAGIAQETSRAFRLFQPLTAYSIDILGSLIGIVVFTTMSFLGFSPVVWFTVAFILMALLSPKFSMVNAVLMGIGVGLFLMAMPKDFYTAWSPYQKINVTPLDPEHEAEGYRLLANGIGHQSMKRVGEKEPIYDFPYLEVKEKIGKKKDYENALIIGAGSGTDVSYALHYGVKQIDAVEIDPQIQAAGRKFHPARPYDSDKVTRIINDGRAFMARTDKKYDLIIFALPDSLALVSSFSSIRLESFLFTVESFTQAKKLLKPDGVLVLYNYYRKNWLVQKLSAMLEKVFEHPAFVVIYPESSGVLSALAIGPNLVGEGLKDQPSAKSLATDDWPFLYMEHRELPGVYLWIILMIIGFAAVGVLIANPQAYRGLTSAGPFFLMGAAFLLLETKSVIQFALLFGATWIVNSLVFFAILVSVLIANAIVQRFRFRHIKLLFGLLFATLIVNYLIPLRWLLQIDSAAVRYVTASLLIFSPIFIANLLFGNLFKDSKAATAAFGWNIVGTMLGGALEYTSLVFGYSNLSLIVLALYVGAAVWTYFVLQGSASSREETDRVKVAMH